MNEVTMILSDIAHGEARVARDPVESDLADGTLPPWTARDRLERSFSLSSLGIRLKSCSNNRLQLGIMRVTADENLQIWRSENRNIPCSLSRCVLSFL